MIRYIFIAWWNPKQIALWWKTRHARRAYRRLFADKAVRIHDKREVTYGRKQPF